MAPKLSPASPPTLFSSPVTLPEEWLPVMVAPGALLPTSPPMSPLPFSVPVA